MRERRRAKRTKLQVDAIANRLDGTRQVEADIHVVDVSQLGVGFSCDKLLRKGTLYESNLTIWTKEVLHTIFEIVRIEKKDDTISYGAIFVGMPEMESARIAVYQTMEDAV